MTRTRILIVAILALLSLGLAAGLAAGGASADGETSTDVTTTAPVTDPGTGTTTTDPTTTTETTTDTTPTTTTTADSPPPTPTTTTDQITTQAAPTTPTTTDSTPPATPPTAPCDTTQITCGNNAATQVAIVSQICNAVSGPSLITIQVQSLDGKPLNNFTVSPSTTCLNVLSITQVVQQFCIGCTLVVVPPPPAVTRGSTPAPVSAPARALYCMPQPVYRTDGTWGDTVDLVVGQPQTDPRYAGATPATYTAGQGYSCPNGAATANDDLNPTTPLFTLTVPASFIGQWINLCVQPKAATQKATCHSIRIDNGATVAIPVTSNVAATVTSAAGVKGAKKTIVKKNKSRKQIRSASKAFAGLQAIPKKHHAQAKHPKQSKHSTKVVKH